MLPIVLALMLGTGGLLRASELSQLQTTQALQEFQNGRSESALHLLDEAVGADGSDIFARYYRGTVRGHLERYDDAIDDLRSVLKERPDLLTAALELGVTYFRAQRYDAALPWLEQARGDPLLSSRASLFIGLAQLRRQDPQAAEPQFLRAAESEEFRLAGEFYLGVAAFRLGHEREAEAHFSAVLIHQPDSVMAREARQYLELLRGSGAAKYSLGATLSMQYDSNVILAPSDEAEKNALGISRQGDGRFSVAAGGRYAPWRNDAFELWLGYQFFQSLYFDLTQYNLQEHQPQVDLVWHFKPVDVGISGRYHFYLREADRFLQQGSGSAWMRVAEGDFGRTEISYLVRRRDYFERDLAGGLDALNHAVDLRQFFYLRSSDRYLWLGYAFDRNGAEHTAGKMFAYDGNELQAGLGWTFPALDLSADLVYRFRHERYDSPSDGRRDHEHGVGFVLNRRLTDHLAIIAAYYGTFNDSTSTLYRYDRQIGSIGLDIRY
ncbi:MAG: tetratricopeptide repeat protein [Deltaproteobacteria bacterium]|nr:tetratricopeptide repeat protein [Deltaproteobacteria bacterium]